MDKCISHIEKTGDANLPECDQSAAKAAYDQARSKVLTHIPALAVIDERWLAGVGKVMGVAFYARKRRAASNP